MTNITYIKSPDDFLNIVSKKIKQTDVVLDIGCGIQPQKYIKPIVHICVEPYEQYAEYLLGKKEENNCFFVVLKQKWNEIINILPKNGIDSVIALDVIEHINKDEGLYLLKKTIPLARKQVIIFTPYGFLPQEVPEGAVDARGLDGAERQKHKSGWTESDFDDQWNIYICPEFHFFDAITKQRFEKPFGAMFAILTKDSKNYRNIYSVVKYLLSFFSHTIPLFIKSSKILYPSFIKKIYRKHIMIFFR